MNIETVFNTGDKVFYLSEKKVIQSDSVNRISVFVSTTNLGEDEIIINYSIGKSELILNEYYVFKSPEDLTNALLFQFENKKS